MVEGVGEVKPSSPLTLVNLAAWLEGSCAHPSRESEPHLSPFSALLKSEVRTSKIMNSFLSGRSREAMSGNTRSRAAELYFNGSCLVRAVLIGKFQNAPSFPPAPRERAR